MFKIIKKTIRPSKDILFYFHVSPASEEFMSYLKKKYYDTNKLLSSSSKVSDDELEYVQTLVWKSHEDFLEFVVDDFCLEKFLSPQQAYEVSNNIRTEIITEQQD
jgi:hypothetical protein